MGKEWRKNVADQRRDHKRKNKQFAVNKKRRQ